MLLASSWQVYTTKEIWKNKRFGVRRSQRSFLPCLRCSWDYIGKVVAKLHRFVVPLVGFESQSSSLRPCKNQSHWLWYPPPQWRMVPQRWWRKTPFVFFHGRNALPYPSVQCKCTSCMQGWENWIWWRWHHNWWRRKKSCKTTLLCTLIDLVWHSKWRQTVGWMRNRLWWWQSKRYEFSRFLSPDFSSRQTPPWCWWKVQ